MLTPKWGSWQTWFQPANLPEGDVVWWLSSTEQKTGRWRLQSLPGSSKSQRGRIQMEPSDKTKAFLQPEEGVFGTFKNGSWGRVSQTWWPCFLQFSSLPDSRHHGHLRTHPSKLHPSILWWGWARLCFKPWDPKIDTSDEISISWKTEYSWLTMLC